MSNVEIWGGHESEEDGAGGHERQQGGHHQEPQGTETEVSVHELLDLSFFYNQLHWVAYSSAEKTILKSGFHNILPNYIFKYSI